MRQDGVFTGTTQSLAIMADNMIFDGAFFQLGNAGAAVPRQKSRGKHTSKMTPLLNYYATATQSILELEGISEAPCRYTFERLRLFFGV